MSIALLVYAATEYKVRKTMKEHKLTIPTPDHKKDMDRPTLMRLFQYIANHNIQVCRAHKGQDAQKDRRSARAPPCESAYAAARRGDSSILRLGRICDSALQHEFTGRAGSG